MIGPRGLGKGGKSVASSCSEGGTAGVRAPRARAAYQSNVARILAAPCTHKRPASRATFSTSAAATRHSLSPLLLLVCARGAPVRVSPGLQRRRARAPPGLGASVAGLRHSHLIRHSAGLRQHLHLRLRARAVPPAWHARFLPPASAAQLARVRRPPAPRGPGACLPGRTSTALYGCVKSARACWPQFCWALRSGSEAAAAAAATAVCAFDRPRERLAADLTAACAHSVGKALQVEQLENIWPPLLILFATHSPCTV